MRKISCPKCGAAIDGKSLYCSFCGSALIDVRDILKEKAMLEIEKDKNAESLKTLHESTRLENRLPIMKMVFMLIAILLVIFILLIGAGKI